MSEYYRLYAEVNVSGKWYSLCPYFKTSSGESKIREIYYAQSMFRSMEDLLNDPSVRIFVCENQGEKAGMMVLKYSNAVAEIIGIAVPEKLHRRGIGRNMIQFVLKSESLEKLEAQTDDDSVGFYRKCGFTVERIVVDYPDGSVVRYNCVLNK